MADFTNEITALSNSITDLGKKIDDGCATKSELKKHAEAVAELSKNMDKQHLASKTNRVFGDAGVAMDFVKCMQGAIAQSPFQLTKASPFHMDKADLNTYGSGTGTETVPTAVSDVFSMLLSQGFINRQYATVLSGVQGNVTLTKRNGTSTAAFTGSGSLHEDVAVTPASMGTASVTLSPAQISAISLVSEKLLYASAVNIAEMVALDLVEQAGVLEDNSIIKGDGTSTYGNVTGVNNDSNFASVSVAAASFTSLDKVFALIGAVHESCQNSPNSRFFMSGAMSALIRAFKPSGYTYYWNPTTGVPEIAGYPVVIWHRMDSTIATGKNAVYFGDLSKAWTVGTGRDMALQVDRSVKFLTNQAAFRLTYDWHAVAIQPTALAKLILTS